MEFKLCYKSYSYKPSLRAIKEFKESTGLDLWATLTQYMGVFTRSRKDGETVAETMHKLSCVIGFVEAAQLLYCLAKQESSVTIDEIEDAMYHAGMLPSDRDNDMSEPYPFVLYMVAMNVEAYHAGLSKDVKKQQAHL